MFVRYSLIYFILFFIPCFYGCKTTTTYPPTEKTIPLTQNCSAATEKCDEKMNEVEQSLIAYKVFSWIMFLIMFIICIIIFGVWMIGGQWVGENKPSPEEKKKNTAAAKKNQNQWEKEKAGGVDTVC